jgi:hypothetical protein
MNFEIDDFLDQVDEWKFKLHEELKNMTAAERAAFWQQATDKARAAGFRVVEPEVPAKPRAKRRPRASG